MNSGEGFFFFHCTGCRDVKTQKKKSKKERERDISRVVSGTASLAGTADRLTQTSCIGLWQKGA
jgi:hypothetical protein